MATRSSRVIRYPVSTVPKSDSVDLPIGFFCDERYKHVSAVIYSPVAGMGKIRALARDPVDHLVFTTVHPNPDSIEPRVRRASKGCGERCGVCRIVPFVGSCRRSRPVRATSNPTVLGATRVGLSSGLWLKGGSDTARRLSAARHRPVESHACGEVPGSCSAGVLGARKVSTGPAGGDVGKVLRSTGSPRRRASSAEPASTHTHPAA